MKQLLTLLLICLSLGAGAQKKQHRIDSLRIMLTAAGEDTAKVKLLLKIAHAYISTEKEETIKYAEQAMELAQKLGDNKDEAAAHNQLGLAYTAGDKYFKALKNYHDELDISRDLKDRQAEGRALYNIATLYTKLNYLNKALDNFDQAKAIFEEMGNKKSVANVIGGTCQVYIKKAGTILML